MQEYIGNSFAYPVCCSGLKIMDITGGFFVVLKTMLFLVGATYIQIT